MIKQLLVLSLVAFASNLTRAAEAPSTYERAVRAVEAAWRKPGGVSKIAWEKAQEVKEYFKANRHPLVMVNPFGKNRALVIGLGWHKDQDGKDTLVASQIFVEPNGQRAEGEGIIASTMTFPADVDKALLLAAMEEVKPAATN